MNASFFLLILLNSSLLLASDVNLATWSKLFHYQQEQLYIKSPDFLATLDQNQAFNLDKEISYWEKTFTEQDKKHICRFPARYWWWSKGKKLLPENVCPVLAKFLADFDYKEVSIVFSSYYAQNSASLFGHTLLRFSRSHSKNQELLDWGVSYSADIKNINPLEMVYKSFFSTFDGSLQLMPYYYKVREYNDFEFRPLWSYKLKISEQEIKFLLYHIWELSQFKIPYQYLTHNCSSLILDILAIIRPEADFRQNLAFYHIPIDTVKVLKKNKMLDEYVHYRASLMQEWEDKFNQLSQEDKKHFKKFTKSHDTQMLQNIDVLDAALDFYDFKYGKELLSHSKDYQNLQNEKNNLLIARSKLVQKKYPTIKSQQLSPDHVHDTRRIGAGLNLDDNEQRKFILKYRFAYHDPIDPTDGMTSRMKINFLQPEISFDENQSLKIEKVDFLDIASWSYSPPLSHSLSYELGIFWLRWQQRVDDSSNPFEIKGTKIQSAAGYTFDFLSQSYLATMIEQQISYADNRTDHLAWKLGPQVFVHTDLEKMKFRITGKLLYELTGYQEYNRYDEVIEFMANFVIRRDLVLSLKQTHYNNYNESHLAWYYYY